MFRTYERSRVFETFVEVLEAFGNFGTYRNNTLYSCLLYTSDAADEL